MMKRITSTDLANWAPTRNCQENLPLLIRRLIRASDTDIIKLQIPAGDNIILPGYDGIVEVINGTENIPSGISVWEIGSGKDYKEKAQRDFKKRSNKIDLFNSLQTAFVFVTPYTWKDKEIWIKEKKKLDIWKDVKVIDGQNLEDWIEQLPIIGTWISNFLQTPFANIQALDQFWIEWSTTIKYTISSTLVVSGRDVEVNQLADFFLDNPKLLTIKASTIEEAISFIAATVERLDQDLKEKIFSRTAIVKNEQDFRSISSNVNPMTLIVGFQTGSLVDQAVRNCHHVIVPIGNDITAKKADINLSRIRKKGFEKGLEDMGFKYEEAEKLTRDSGQSLSVLRRLLEFEKNQQPEWAKVGNHVEIIPALLAGKWDESKDEDKSLIELLSTQPYDKFTAVLTRWKVENDPPILQVKSSWRLTSALDAWSILSRFVSKSDLENFRKAFLLVLQEMNPALELDPDKRHLASLYGKAPKYSYSLKEGLCQSLILIAVFGDEFELNTLNSSQEFADELVYDLLFDASGDKWCNIHALLPLLAEASPKSFIRAVEDSLNKKDPPIMKMFGDFAIFSSTSYYTYLLWALENLLISPDYLLKITLILGQLSRLDPGGKLSNRPINTLRETFTPYYGQTRAGFSIRKIALQKLALREPEIAWKLFISISPQDHLVVSPIHQCKWRFDTQHLERKVTNQEVWDFNSFLFDQLINLSKGNEQKISELIQFYPNLNNEERGKLILYLKECKEAYIHKQNLIWNELRKLLSQHREHSEQKWALPKDELDKIEQILFLYNPIDVIERNKFLFEAGWISLPEGFKRRKMSFDDKEKIFSKMRMKAFKEIYELKGLKAILEMVNGLDSTNYIACAAAKFILKKNEENKLFSSLNSVFEKKQDLFIRDYIFYKAIFSGLDWVIPALRSIDRIHSNPKTIANFFLALPQKKEIWELLDTVDDKISKIYWRGVHPQLYHEHLQDKLYVIRKLQDVDRHSIIIDELAYREKDVPSDILTDILLKAATIPSSDNIKLNKNDVGRLFEIIYKRGDVDKEFLLQLEWIYLPFIAGRYTNQKPINLLLKIKTNPKFAVEVVSYVYFSEINDNAKISEEEKFNRYHQANGARSLLDSFRDIPGVGDDGAIDSVVLNQWIKIARMEAENLNLLYEMDSQIGKLLARYPRNNISWPHEEICETIDSLNSNDILSSFKSEIFNSRGVYGKSPYEGGIQEKNLAEYFRKMGNQIQPNYPFTSSALFELARGYERDAKLEDESAYLDELN